MVEPAPTNETRVDGSAITDKGAENVIIGGDVDDGDVKNPTLDSSEFVGTVTESIVGERIEIEVGTSVGAIGTSVGTLFRAGVGAGVRKVVGSVVGAVIGTRVGRGIGTGVRKIVCGVDANDGAVNDTSVGTSFGAGACAGNGTGVGQVAKS